MRAFHFRTGTLMVVCFLAGALLSSGQAPQASGSESLASLRERADHGVADAQLALGRIYLWMSLATGRVNKGTQDELAARVAELAAKMTPQEIAEAQRLAREWKPPGK